MFDFSVPKPDRPDSNAMAPRTVPLDMHSILAVIRHQWRQMMITAGLFVLGAAAAIPIMPEGYTAKAQIFIEPADLRVVDKSVIDSSQLNDTATSQVESQSRILVSRTVLAHVVDQQNLAADVEFNGKQPGLFTSIFGPIMTAVASQPSLRQNDDVSLLAVDNLQRHVRVERLPQSFIVELSVSTNDANKSAHLANAITKAYLDEEASSQATTVRRASDSLSGRLESLRESASAAEEKVQRFKQKHQLIVAAGQSVMEAQTAELSNQLVLARTRMTAAKVRFEQTKKMLTSGFDAGELPESLASPTISRLRDQYAETARREAVLAATLGPQHPALVQARSDLAKARTLLNEEIVRVAQSSRDDYDRAVADEASLANSLQASKDEILKAGDAEVALHELQRDAEAKRNVYESLAVRSREIGEQAGIDTNNIRVISTATAPMSRNFPPPTSLILSAAFMLGFGASGARAVVRARRPPMQRL